jgi:hypothetical protein
VCSVVLAALCAIGVVAPPAAEAATVNACVYDPAGKAGDYYRMMEEWSLAAAGWGATVQLTPYTDEATAAKDYEAGKCDVVVATGVRLQRFNRFPSTIEAMGAIPSYDAMKSLLTSVTTSASAAAKLRSGEHETVGFIPVGAVYLFVRDRSKDTVPELAGRRIATMDYDKAAPAMVQRIGAVMVAADLASIGPKFNNGDVDACYVSAPAYKPFELWRGVGTSGGVLKLPLAQATLQVMVRADKLPAGMGASSRTWFLGKFDSAVALVKKAEAEIPASSWVAIPASDLPGFDELFQSVRLQLRDAGAYDPTMLKVMRQIRCGADPARAECAEQLE